MGAHWVWGGLETEEAEEISMEVVEVKSEEELLAEVKKYGLAILNLHASWAEPCAQMNEVFSALARKKATEKAVFVKMNAELSPKLMSKLAVDSVPTFLFLRASGDGFAEQGRVEGAEPADLARRVDDYVESASLSVNERIKKLLEPPIILFMKGNPGTPKCKFSRAILEILDSEQIPFEHFNILADEEIRQGLKEYSKWPTYPQLYAGGNLVGGVDVVRELHESNELRAELGLSGDDLEARLRKLITQQDIMLFMKGSPDAPRCGFSKTIVQILRDNEVQFGSFDILMDPEVRQGLKAFSKWPTFPQLYKSGELIGGVDVVRELNEMGELKSELT